MLLVDVNSIKFWVALVLLLFVVITLVVLGIRNRWIVKLFDTAKKACAEAEQKFGAGHGAEKKEFVLNALKEKCKELGIPYETIKNGISKLIEVIVASYNAFIKGNDK